MLLALYEQHQATFTSLTARKCHLWDLTAAQMQAAVYTVILKQTKQYGTCTVVSNQPCHSTEGNSATKGEWKLNGELQQ